MLSSSRKLLKQQINALLVVVFVAGCAFAQGPSLSLASGTAVKGGSVSLNLSLSAATSAPSGLQWTISYPSADITSLSSVAGPALTAANKTLTCSVSTGSVTCLAMGMDSAVISSGVVAVVTAAVSPNASSSQDPLPLSNVTGTLMDGTMLGLSATGGVISVAQSALPTVSSLQCTPASVTSGSTSTCTVTLSSVPAASASVAISDNSAALTVPATVTVGAGATTANFTATAGSVSANQAATVTATFNGSSKTTSVTVTPPGSTPTGLMTAYGFDEASGTMIADASGNGNSGILQGATSTTAGKYGNALSFNGSSYVDIGNGASLQTTGSMTWSAWIYATANPGDDGDIVSKSSGVTGWQFKTTPDTGSRTFGILISPDGTTYTERCSNTVRALNTWYHVAAVYNASARTLDIYVNGVLDNGVLYGTVPASQYTNSSENATIGRRAGGFLFSGVIDNLRIYNRAQSASEIQADMGTPVSTGGSAPPPATVTGLTCTPASVTSGSTSTCTVTLSSAPAASASVAISDNSAALTVPATVTVGAGATTANFAATAGTVSANQTATVTATFNGSSKTASVTITPVAGSVSALQCTPASVTSGSTSTCTVTLSSAPAASASVAISDNSAALTVPATVTVGAGATTANFAATAGTVSANQTATVTAAFNGSSKTASIAITPVAVSVSALQCTPASVTSGSTSTCTVTLSSAPAASASVAISDNSAALTVPATVTVGAGATTANFAATAGTVSANQTATVTAAFNGSSKTASIAITPVAVSVSALQCTPASVTSGSTSTCTVTLSSAPAASASVAISDNSAALTVPATVAVGAGATTANFTATAGTVSANQTATVTATFNGSSKTASVAITPVAVSVSALQCTPASATSGSTFTCTVTLSSAPAASASVAISDNSAALTVPATVTVGAGATTANFTATAGTVSANQTATVTATFNGSSKTASVTIIPAVTGVSAAYLFEEGSGTTVADASGNGATGQIQGATWTTSGKHGKALSFDGSSSYVDLGRTPMQSFGSMSWSAWVKASGNSAGEGQIIALSDNSSGWQLKVTPNTGNRTFGVAVSGSAGSRVQRYSKTVYSLNAWYFVAGVYNATAKTLDIYVNGVSDNGTLTGTVPALQYMPAVNASIGKHSGGSYFMGVIDDLRVYSRALTAAEIQSDMNAAVTTMTLPKALVSTLQSSRSTSPAVGGQLASGDERLSSPAPQEKVSSLWCLPRTAKAGSEITCELRVDANGTGSQIQLAGTSSDLKLPQLVATRAGQSRLTFQALIEPAARAQSLAISAALNGSSAQDTIQVAPSLAPVLTVQPNQIAKSGSKLSFAIHAVDPMELPISVSVTNVPAGALFDPAAGKFEWTPNLQQIGKFDVTFTASNSLGQSASAHVSIDVDSGAPVLNASDGLVCSPGAIGTLNGRWLADSALSNPTGETFEIGGTKVKVNGDYVPVLRVSPLEVKFVCPALDAGAQLRVVVENGSRATEPLVATMQEASPEIFSIQGSAHNQGVVSHLGTSDFVTERTFRIAGYPAQIGDEIVIWGSGFGPQADVSNAMVSVRLGGFDAEVKAVSAVPGFAGVYAVRVRVPAVTAPGSAVPVELQVMGAGGRLFNSNSVTIAVEVASR